MDGKTTGLAIVYLASFVVVVAGIKLAQSIINPFLVAVFISIVSAPAMFWLEKKGIPRFLAFIIILVFLIFLITFVGIILASSINSLISKLPQYQEQLNSIMRTSIQWLEARGFKEDIYNNLSSSFNLNPSSILNFVVVLLGGLSSTLSNILLIFITITFILFESSLFPKKIVLIVGKDDLSIAPFKLFVSKTKHYLAIKTVISFATCIVVAISLYVLKVDYIFLWALIAFLLNYIPTIGSIIAAIPAILFALIENGYQNALSVAVAYLIINFVIGNFLEPKFMGRGLGLSTLVVFLSLLFWGWVLGPVGMFLSVPLTMTLKIAFDTNQNTRWMSILLGDGKGN